MNITNGSRYLIVNADDFGRSLGVNHGIIQAHEKGIVTSASLMVRWPLAIEAALYACEHPDLSLGLHLDLEELFWEHGAWVQRYQVIRGDDPKAVEREALLQLEAFRRLTGKNPTHLDSHQHVHQNDPVRSTLAEIADWLGIPLRGCSWQVRHCGDFYGQDSKGRPTPRAITVEGFYAILERLEPGFTELSCHPGVAGDWNSMYKFERTQEIQTLCHPGLRAKLAGLNIDLCSFHKLVAVPRHGVAGATYRFPSTLRTA